MQACFGCASAHFRIRPPSWHRKPGLSIVPYQNNACNAGYTDPISGFCRNARSTECLLAPGHLYSWVERGTVRERLLPKTCPGLEHGPLDPFYSARTIRPLKVNVSLILRKVFSSQADVDTHTTLSKPFNSSKPFQTNKVTEVGNTTNLATILAPSTDCVSLTILTASSGFCK